MKDADARVLLRDLFDAALAAARPATCLAPHIAALQPPKGKTVVIGAGKASAAMARAVEDQWPHPLEGLVVTRYGYGEACKKIEIVEAAHPVPDEKGRAAAGRILEKVRGLTADDLVLCLISGGASALLALPAPGLTLADKQDVNRALLKSGANIVEMNTLRKHLSAIKGGRLAIAAQPARVLSWLISDVPNDDPGVIGSGPTVPDRTTFADALAVLAKYRIDPPAAVRAHLQTNAGMIERLSMLIQRRRPSPAIPGWRGWKRSWSPRPSARSRPPPLSRRIGVSGSSCWATISRARRASSAPRTHAGRSISSSKPANRR